MLFVNHTTSTAAAKDYFTEQLSRSDYYMDGQEITCSWHGLAAEVLGLAGPVDKESYFRLCDNLHPVTGDQLTPRIKADRRITYDFTFDAPKSVSLAYELGRDERIVAEFRAAVEETMAEMEQAMMVRVRTLGRDEDRTSANWCWAEFIHRTTRPMTDASGACLPDPQLHCHAVAFNVSFDPVEERWKAGQFGNVVRDKGYYQAAFHSRFAKRLADLGYGIERDGNSFRLAGISKETCEKFSRRTAIIEAEAERLGITDPKTKGELGRRTRERKVETAASMSELRQIWDGWMTEPERAAVVGARSGYETRTANAVQAMDYALAHCYTRQSAIPETELLKHALIQGVGRATVADVQREVLRKSIIRCQVEDQVYATTADVLREEMAMVEFVRGGRGMYDKLGVASALRMEGLSAEQREAALVILNSRDGVTGLRGGAGTGKTRMMQATIAAVKAAVATTIADTGRKVFTLAPSSDAAHIVLRAEGFEEAETVAQLLWNPRLQKEVSGHILWIDEAGLLSTPDMKKLFDFAGQHGCRVVLSGDAKQHKSIERGDAFRVLESEAGMKMAELKEVRRQKAAQYRSAVELIRDGERVVKGRSNLAAGMEALEDMGAIIEIAGEERYRHIAADYLGVVGHGEKTALVVTALHSDGDKITANIRDGLRKAGKLEGTEEQVPMLRGYHFTPAQKGDYANYEAGQVIQWNQNRPGFKRGEQARVLAAEPASVTVMKADGSTAKISLSDASRFDVFRERKGMLASGDLVRFTRNAQIPDDRMEGRKLRVPKKFRIDNGMIMEVAGFTKDEIKFTNGLCVPKNHGNLTHAYVVTSRPSQGKTVDEVIGYNPKDDADLYVTASRGRNALRIYTDDKAAMMDAVRRSSQRLSAIELMKGQAPPKKPPVVRAFALRQMQRADVSRRMPVAAREPVHTQQQELQHGA